MITIDGSEGEGGGQILRTSLALSLVTGAPLCMEKIRAGRRRPGLMRQHLTAVQAASAVGRAEVEGAEVGSGKLSFRPRGVFPGDYTFTVGTAGSATLVLETVLPALIRAGGPSRLTLEGGTHNPLAPTFDFLDRAFLPLLRRMGAGVTAILEKRGYYPAGGGRFQCHVEPGAPVPLDLDDRGEILSRRATVLLANLPFDIARRELDTLAARLGWPASELSPLMDADAEGPGNVVSIEVESARVTEVFTSFGERGVRSEEVAEHAARETKEYLAANVPVGRHLADQLLLPLALLAGGAFRTLSPSLHTHTQMEIIRRFLALPTRATELPDRTWRIEVPPWTG